jgi:regulator of sigma E protease
MNLDIGGGIALLFGFVLVLASAILIHELGHFLAARAVGVRIIELGIGLPPRLVRIGTWAGANITLNWIPLGGFVKPDGEFDPSVKGGLAGSSPLARLGVFGAGSLANILLCLVLLTIAFMSGWPDEVQVLYVSPDSPSEDAGLLAGDKILTANGQQIRSAEELGALIAASIEEPLILTFARGSSTIETQLIPRAVPPEGEGHAGFTSQGVIVRYGFGRALLRAFEQMADLVESTIRLSAAAISGDGTAVPVRLTGPLGLKQASDVAIRNAVDWKQAFPVLFIGAWLSLALAITNLLPLPALDGGRALFVLIEIIRGRRVDPKRERLVHAVGIVALLALMLVLTIRDVVDPLL